MSNLSDLLPAGAGAKSATFTASGTLATGTTVALQSDGTVKAIASDATSVPQAVGSSSVYESANSQNNAVAYDSTNNKLLIVYADYGNSAYGTAVVATLSGSTFTFGTPTVFASRNAQDLSVVYSTASDKFVISHNQSGGRSVVATVSGTSVSFGTENTWSTNNLDFTVSTYDPVNDKVIILYQDGSNSDQGYYLVGTISGTSISFGSAGLFASGVAVFWVGVTYDSTNEKVIAVFGNSTSSLGQAKVGTVSGSTISWGSAGTFESGAMTKSNVAAHDVNQNKTFVVYRDGVDIFGIVGTVSGTSISFGSRSSIYTGSTQGSQTVQYHAAAQKMVFTSQQNNNELNSVICTVSGTSFSQSSTILLSNTGDHVGSVYDANAKQIAVVYRDTGNSNYGTAITITPAYTASNVADFVGLTDEAIANAATGSVVVEGGVTEKLSGLTVGATYYVQSDGSLETDTVTVPYRISGASYTNKSFSVTQDTNPWSISFNSNQTKMYVTGGNTAAIYQYSLSTAGDVSTASYDSVSFSVSSQDTGPTGMAFNNDGTKMYVLGNANDSVFQYSLSSAFDMSSASYDSVSFSIASQETTPRSIRFNNDGTSMYVAGTVNDSVYQYTLTSAFDLSTASYASKTFSFTSETSDVRAVLFNGDGTKMYMLDATNDDLKQYSLSSAFDVSTASYDNVSFDISSQDNNPLALHFNSDGTVFYYAGNASDTIYQYDAGSGSTSSVTAGKALSTTKLLLKG
jgi:sugar lactone lactonase YvrE